MYAMVEADYSLADIERFVELSIRRGIGFSSLARLDAGAGDVRVAAGAALLGVAADAPIARAALRRALGAFLSGPGDWLAESVEALEAKLFELGLLESDAHAPADRDDSLVRSRLLPRPGVTARRLVDELEAAREVLARRRALRRTALQTKNREVNSAAPEVDQEADLRFMRMALDAAREAAAADEVPVGAVLTQGDAVLAVTNNRTLRDRDRARMPRCLRFAKAPESSATIASPKRRFTSRSNPARCARAPLRKRAAGGLCSARRTSAAAPY